jgi:hypothetical protein
MAEDIVATPETVRNILRAARKHVDATEQYRLADAMDRLLCLLGDKKTPHKTMTAEEYLAANIKGWHEPIKWQ